MTANIQLLRSSNSKERPNPNMLLDGQVFLNVQSDEPGLYFKTTNTQEVIKVGPVTVGPNEPNNSENRAKGELWLHAGEPWSEPVLKVFDGAEWKVIGGFTPDKNASGETGNLIFNNKLSVKRLEINDSSASFGENDDGFLQLPKSNKPDGAGQIRYNASDNKFQGRIEESGSTKWIDLHLDPMDAIVGGSLEISGRSALRYGLTVPDGGGINTSLGGNVTITQNATIGGAAGSADAVKFPGGFEVGPQKEIRLVVDSASNPQKITGFKAPDNFATGSNDAIIYTLPDTAGAENQVLAKKRGSSNELTWRQVDNLDRLSAGMLNVTGPFNVDGSTRLGNSCNEDTLEVLSGSHFACNVIFKDGRDSVENNELLTDGNKVVDFRMPTLFKEELGIFQRELRFYGNNNGDKSANATYIGLKAPNSIPESKFVWTLPGTDASSSDEVAYDVSALTSNRSGTLEWKKVNPSDLTIESLSVTGTGRTGGDTQLSGSLDIDGAATFNNNVTIGVGHRFEVGSFSTFKGHIYVNNDREIRFRDVDNNDGEYVGLAGPTGERSGDNLVFKLPNSIEAGRILTTDATGQLGWTDKTEIDLTPNFNSLIVGDSSSSPITPGQSRFGGLIIANGGIDVKSGSTIFRKNINALAGISSSKDVGIQSGQGLRLYDHDSDGTNSIRIKAPDRLSNDLTLTLPGGRGPANSYLRNDGIGVLSWVEISYPNLENTTWAGDIVPDKNKARNIGASGTKVNELHVKDIYAETIRTDDLILPTPKPNLLDNGNFDIWQRGQYESNGQSRGNYPHYSHSGSNIRRLYGPDRWFVTHTGSSTNITITRGSHGNNSTLPGGPKYFMDINVDSLLRGSGDLAYIGQRIEDVKKTAGKELTLTFYSKVLSSNSLTLPKFSLHQFTGTGSPVYTRLDAESNMSKTLVSGNNWSQHTVTFRQLPSLTNTSINSNTSYLELRIHIPNGSYHFQLAAVKLEDSPRRTNFVPKTVQEEELNCKRFFQVHPFWDTSDSTSGDTHRIIYTPELRGVPLLKYFSPLRQGTDATIYWNQYVKHKTSKSLLISVDSLSGVDNNPGNIAYVEADAEL